MKQALGTWTTNVQSQIRNLGVIFDSALMFDHQIKCVVKSCFFQLRTIAKMKSFLSVADLEIVIHAFISSRLDYCNALYLGVSQSLISKLQLVQNAAARLLTSTKKREHITPVLEKLHWLPVKYRIQYKVLLYVFNPLPHGVAIWQHTLCVNFLATVSLRQHSRFFFVVGKRRP